MLVKIIFIGRLNSVNVFWLNGQSVLKSDLLDKGPHYANTFVIAIIAARSKSKAELAGHLLSTLTTYKYPEHGPSVLEVVDIQKVPTLSGLTHINLDLKAGEFVSFWDLLDAVKPHCYA